MLLIAPPAELPATDIEPPVETLMPPAPEPLELEPLEPVPVPLEPALLEPALALEPPVDVFAPLAPAWAAGPPLEPPWPGGSPVPPPELQATNQSNKAGVRTRGRCFDQR